MNLACPTSCKDGYLQGREPSGEKCQLSALSAAANSAHPKRKMERNELLWTHIAHCTAIDCQRDSQMASWRALSVALALLLAFCGATQAQRRSLVQDLTLVGSKPRGAESLALPALRRQRVDGLDVAPLLPLQDPCSLSSVAQEMPDASTILQIIYGGHDPFCMLQWPRGLARLSH